MWNKLKGFFEGLWDCIIGPFLFGAFITGIIFVPLLLIFTWLDEYQCNTAYTSFTTEWRGFGTGCMIQVEEDKWIPTSKYRYIEEE